ncbi:hypothetical protein MTO96_048807 [Rhipicephalus appendiculatus]
MAWLSAQNYASVMLVRRPMVQTDNRPTEELWLALENAFQEAMERRSYSQGFSELYSFAYTMVQRNASERLYNGLREAVAKYLGDNVRLLVLAKTGDDFLRTLNQAWRDHQQSMSIIGDIVRYLDIAYVPQNNVDSVEKLGVSLFRDEVVRYSGVRDRLCEALLSLVNEDREGGSVDKLAIKKACDMLESLGHGSRSVYEEDFERPFLAETARYYKIRAQNYVENMDAIEYVAKVEQHIEEESARARQCLNESTVVPVVRVLEAELIGERMKAILRKEDSGVEHMLRNCMTEGLAGTFRLLNREAGGLQTLLECVSKYLRAIGKSIVSEDGDSISLIPRLMDLKARSDHLLRHSFYDDDLAKQTIDSDFQYILSLTEKSPELLSAFVDHMLQHGIKSMSDREIDLFLHEIVAIFALLQQKDIFVISYARHLAKRLLLSRSASYNAEIRFVARFKTEYGFLFSQRLEVMFNDMRTSDALAREFTEALLLSRTDLRVDVNMRVLQKFFWPLPCATQTSNIPALTRSAFETFRQFYLAKYKCRQLILQPQFGSADMDAVFYGPSEEQPSSSKAASTLADEPRTYTIQVSTFQMCVLMLFNSHDKVTYGDIASETNIPEKDLARALRSLCTGGSSGPLLIKTPGTEQIESDHVFTVNEAFTSVVPKVDFQSTPDEIDSSPTNDDTMGSVEEERRYAIDAAIVRLMKARKQLPHDDLIAEVTEVLRARFAASPEALKKRLDWLIQRKYLERDAEHPEVYVYVP